MQTYNWIKAYYTTQDGYYDEREVFVRQEVGKSDTFIDKYGNRFHIFDLDFTRSCADHNAKIDEHEYWRNLRCEIFAYLCKDYRSYSDALKLTETIINRLYEQDQEFFKDK